MPKLTVYVPNSLAGKIRGLGLNVSAILQRALWEEVDARNRRMLRDLPEYLDRLPLPQGRDEDPVTKERRLLYKCSRYQRGLDPWLDPHEPTLLDYIAAQGRGVPTCNCISPGDGSL